jgi:multiple sugar transport system substrate-binding protein
LAGLSYDKLRQSGPGKPGFLLNMSNNLRKFTWVPFLLLALLVLAACNPINPFSLDATFQAPFTRQETSAKTPVPQAEGTQTTQTPAKATPIQLSATPEATVSPTVDPNLLTGLTVQFWHPWSGESGQVIHQLVEEYNLTNELGIQVEVANPGSPENLNAKMKEALNAGEPPDLVAAYLFQALEWNAAHPLVDLTPFIKDATWGLSTEELADFDPAFWEADMAGEQRLAVPALGSGQVLYYNQTWAEELGFTSPPTTPAEFEQQVCAAARSNNQDESTDNDGSGGLILSTAYSPMLGWMDAFGAQVYDPVKATGKNSPYNFSSPEVEQAFTFLRRLYDKGCAWLPEEPYPEEDFANRRGLLAANSVTNLPYQAQVSQHAGSADRWTVIPFPSPDGEPAISSYGPSFEIFSSTPERQLAAWNFVRWLLSPQNQARLADAANSFPARKGALDLMESTLADLPQWSAVLQAQLVARPEPAASSWKTVRWALSDAATQLFRSYFIIDKVPELVKLLNRTAADLHANPPQDGE